MRVRPRMPAVCRERMAVGTNLREVARINSPNPGRSFSQTAAVASGVTSRGTGPAPRDVTPEATAAVCEKLLSGFGELMRATSLKFVPTAILSRQTAGIRGRTLIVILPDGFGAARKIH